MNKAKLNLIQIIKDRYCFYYENEEFSTKEHLKTAIENGLNLEHLKLVKSDSTGMLFDKNTCDYYCCCEYYWQYDEDTPDDIVWSEYSEEYLHIDSAVYCWTDRRNQSYIDADNENVYEYGGDYYTNDALSDHELCEYEGDIYHYDDMVYCEDIGESIPQSYAHYDEDTELYYSDRSNINPNGLKSYHNSQIKDKSNDSKIKIGFEIEKEDSNFNDFSNIRAINWDAEKDGSLNSDGFELVSAIYNLEDLTQLNLDTREITEFLNAGYSKNCGGHINVSIKDKSNKEVFNLIRGYVPLIYAMYYGRLDNRFSTAKKIDELGNFNRYDAFNFTKNSGILEFRIFSAVRTREQLIWRAEFMALLFKHHRKGSASVLKMLFTDSELKKHLLKMYSQEKYSKLIDRVIKYTDIYMTAKDSQQTARIIIDHKNKENLLIEANEVITEKQLN